MRHRPRFLIILLAVWMSAAGAAEDFTDPRDGAVYPVVEVAGMRWMGSNLRFDEPGSICYAFDAELCHRLGRLYAWESALRACPPGWHLSTDYEWQALELALGVPFAELAANRERGEPLGDRLKAGGGGPLQFPLAGYAEPNHSFKRKDEATALWTATESDFNHAWHRDLNVARTGIYRSRVYKPWLLSVRCVADRAPPAR